jgi:hypothetical protein
MILILTIAYGAVASIVGITIQDYKPKTTTYLLSIRADNIK